MATKRTKVALAASPRDPTDQTILGWLQKEGMQLIRQIRDVINNISGKVGVDKYDGLGFAEDKFVSTSTVTVVKGGTTGNQTLGFVATATDPPAVGIYDFTIDLPGLLASGLIVDLGFSRAATYPAGLTGSFGYVHAAPLTNHTVTLKLGTTYAGAATVGTLTTAAGATTIVINVASAIEPDAGDTLFLVFPAIADAQMAGWWFALKGAQV